MTGTATTGRRAATAAATLLAAILCCLGVAGTARATDRIYWINQATNTLAFSALDASEGGVPNLGGLAVREPLGLAIDSVGQRLFWTNRGTRRIAFANLTGSAGENFETGELIVDRPLGLAVDAVGERVYWFNNGWPAFAFLDGSFGETFNQIGTATIASPGALTVDPAGGRLYWTNGAGASPVSYLNLDGSGGGDLNAEGANRDGPQGIAVDPVHGRVYWTNRFSNDFPGGDHFGISYANLDGSGGGNLPTGSARMEEPTGLAVDPIGGRIYWVNMNVRAPADEVSFAMLDGSGGGNLPVAAPVNQPAAPVLYFEPRPEGLPKVGGSPAVGSTLSCSRGEWAPDYAGSFLYEAPGSFGYQWLRGGLEIPGATGPTIVPDVRGAYTCRVTAKNLAGQVARTSAALQVHSVAFSKRTRVSLKPASRRLSARGLLAVKVVNRNDFQVTGRLGGSGAGAKLRAQASKVGPSAAATVKLALPAALRAALARKRLSVALSAGVVDLTGGRRTVKGKLRLGTGR